MLFSLRESLSHAAPWRLWYSCGLQQQLMLLSIGSGGACACVYVCNVLSLLCNGTMWNVTSHHGMVSHSIVWYAMIWYGLAYHPGFYSLWTFWWPYLLLLLYAGWIICVDCGGIWGSRWRRYMPPECWCRCQCEEWSKPDLMLCTVSVLWVILSFMNI